MQQPTMMQTPQQMLQQMAQPNMGQVPQQQTPTVVKMMAQPSTGMGQPQGGGQGPVQVVQMPRTPSGGQQMMMPRTPSGGQHAPTIVKVMAQPSTGMGQAQGGQGPVQVVQMPQQAGGGQQGGQAPVVQVVRQVQPGQGQGQPMAQGQQLPMQAPQVMQQQAPVQRVPSGGQAAGLQRVPSGGPQLVAMPSTQGQPQQVQLVPAQGQQALQMTQGGMPQGGQGVMQAPHQMAAAPPGQAQQGGAAEDIVEIVNEGGEKGYVPRHVALEMGGHKVGQAVVQQPIGVGC